MKLVLHKSYVLNPPKLVMLGSSSCVSPHDGHSDCKQLGDWSCHPLFGVPCFNCCRLCAKEDGDSGARPQTSSVLPLSEDITRWSDIITRV